MGLGDAGGQRAEAAIRAVLPGTAEILAGPRRGDLLVNGVPLHVEWVGEGWLRDVGPVLKSRPHVVVGRRISPGARQALSEARIGWVDETGAAEIALGSIIVSRTGRPEPRSEAPRNWTPAVLAVAEAVLCKTTATVAATTKATGLSTGSCTRALRVLTDLELLTAEAARGRNSAREVADPDQLLDAYAGAAASFAPKAQLTVGAIWRDAVEGLVEIGRKWDEARLEWAATGAVAAAVLAPLLTNVGTADVYVDANTIAGLEAAAASAGLRPIDGGRLVLQPFPTVAANKLASRAGDLRLVPWPRVYADLRIVGVRGEEAAEHLREVMHGR